MNARPLIVGLAALLAATILAGCGEREPEINVVKAVLDADEAAYREQAALYAEQLQTSARQLERTEQQ
jgi:hypothetical protein